MQKIYYLCRQIVKSSYTIMKKSTLFLLLALLIGHMTYAENPKHEFRATWLTTGFGIDWPKTKNLELPKTNINFLSILPEMENILNAKTENVFVQKMNFNFCLNEE